ncbi:unnamed protein product [Fusarium graminearum]|nr:unnamed protein product [Fusarium graminearum]
MQAKVASHWRFNEGINTLAAPSGNLPGHNMQNLSLSHLVSSPLQSTGARRAIQCWSNSGTQRACGSLSVYRVAMDLAGVDSTRPMKPIPDYQQSCIDSHPLMTSLSNLEITRCREVERMAAKTAGVCRAILDKLIRGWLFQDPCMASSLTAADAHQYP